MRTLTPRLLKRKGIIGNSPEIDHYLSLVAKAASTGVNVLLTGETGTGKELFASAIHKNSHRTKKALVVVDCATLPDNLIESILFGHEKGSFTGADQQREGLIKEADGGTLFLDEVGELPLQQHMIVKDSKAGYPQPKDEVVGVSCQLSVVSYQLSVVSAGGYFEI